MGRVIPEREPHPWRVGQFLNSILPFLITELVNLQLMRYRNIKFNEPSVIYFSVICY